MFGDLRSGGYAEGMLFLDHDLKNPERVLNEIFRPCFVKNLESNFSIIARIDHQIHSTNSA